MTLTDAVLEAMLTALIDTGAPLDPAGTWIGVATAVDEDGQFTTLSDVTQATGAVGTRVPVTAWVGPYRLADGRWAVDSPVAHFTPASSAEGQVVSYAFLASALTAGALKAFDPVIPPVNLVDENNTLAVVVRVTIDPDGRWSANVFWNG